MASLAENKSFGEVPKYVINKYKASLPKVDEIDMLYTCPKLIKILL